MMVLFMRNLLLQFRCKKKKYFEIFSQKKKICFSDGDEDEDEGDEGITEPSKERSPSDDGKQFLSFSFFFLKEKRKK